MPRDLEILTPSLRAAAARTEAVAGTLGRAVGDLECELRRVGDCWGGDEPGRAFADGYGPASRALLDQVTSLVLGLGSTGDGLCSMADDFDAAERASQIRGGE